MNRRRRSVENFLLAQARLFPRRVLQILGRKRLKKPDDHLPWRGRAVFLWLAFRIVGKHPDFLQLIVVPATDSDGNS